MIGRKKQPSEPGMAAFKKTLKTFFMTTINLSKIDYDYDAETRLFTISEKDTTFDTSYSLLNPKTGKSKQFDLSHSTGSEWDPETKWIYESEDGIILEIEQEKEITDKRSEMYLDVKTKNH